MNDTLIRNGITPPTHGKKTRCPQCSDFRKKKLEKCLSVWTNCGLVWWKCFHCKWDSSDVIV